jgi:nucleotide-binding universal stress UspA family protein
MELFPARVLAAVHKSESASTALDAARQVCAATSSELWLVHVKLLSASIVGDPMGSTRYDDLEREGQTYLDELTASLAADGGVPVTSSAVRLSRSVERSVAGFAEEIAAGLIVIGGTSRGAVQRTVAGDIAVSLVRSTPCSVMVVPPHVAGSD